MLEGVGVTPRQERLYRVLLNRPATIRDLTEATGLPRGSVTADLKLPPVPTAHHAFTNTACT